MSQVLIVALATTFITQFILMGFSKKHEDEGEDK